MTDSCADTIMVGPPLVFTVASHSRGLGNQSLREGCTVFVSESGPCDRCVVVHYCTYCWNRIELYQTSTLL